MGNQTSDEGREHFRIGGAWALMGGTRDGTSAERIAQAYALKDKLYEAIPFVKALGRLALENQGRARELWAQTLREPMPFGGEAIGMPRVANLDQDADRARGKGD